MLPVRLFHLHVFEEALTYIIIVGIAYSPAIVVAMLQSQQTTAIIAERKKIVEGAVSMVRWLLIG